MKPLAAFCLFLLATVQTASCSSAEPNVTQDETATNDNFLIEGCRAELRASLLTVIRTSLRAISPAIRDIQNSGTNSLYGYKAMFKINETTDAVVQLLRDMARLKPMPNLLPDFRTPQRPRFICVHRNTVHVYPVVDTDPFSVCELSAITNFYVIPTAYIFLCPRFWNMPRFPDPEVPPARGRCPGVKDNVYTVSHGYEVYFYQSYAILHELVHFYLQHASLSGITIPPERYNLNGCVEFDVVYSLLNPMNYQVYIAMLEHGCVNSPDPYLPPWVPSNAPRNDSLPPGFNLRNWNASSPQLTLPSTNLSTSPGLVANPNIIADSMNTS